MIKRCPWPKENQLYMDYHDKEWGVPLHDDYKIFEFLTLETFQAGLSWITVLRKRENFRKAFDLFDFNKVAHYDEVKFQALLNNPGIIRNKLKIKAAITNAQAFIKLREEHGSFSNYIWAFTGGQPIVNRFDNISELPSKTPLSDHISMELKKHGFKFVGSTVIYAHMQATGMVNDHLTDCYRHEECQHL